MSQLAQPALPRSMGNGTVQTIRGQLHKFMLIPPIEHHCLWFDAGPVAIAVESRALGDARAMVRGPSIHVFDATRSEEYIRFDLFGRVLHYHYILNAAQHNILWGYDPDANGPMLSWAIAAMRDRLPMMLRRAGEPELAMVVEEVGWNRTVLTGVAQAAAAALRPCDDDLSRAQEGMAWMARWKDIHPQFNTVEAGEY